MKNSFTNCRSCLLAEMAKVARLVARPRKCYINRLERFIFKRHTRNRSTNQIARKSLFSSEIIPIKVIIYTGPCARFDWSKTHALSEYKLGKKRVLLFFSTLPVYHKANEEA